MRRIDNQGIAWLIGFTCAIWLSITSAAVAADWSCAAQETLCKTVYIVHNSWHAAIVLPRDDLNVQILPELRDFPSPGFIEFSWGDQDFFPDPDSGVWAGLHAAFWSSGSVVHMVAIRANPRQFYPGAEIFELRLDPSAQQKLIHYLSASFARSGAGPAPARPGLFSYSRFYPSRQKFSFLRTCNTWVAEALEAAGLPVAPRMVFTANNLAHQIAPLSKAASAP